MAVLEHLVATYWNLSEEFHARGDPRANEYLLMQSYWPTALICIVYVGVMTYGQRWIRHRKAWDLRGTMVAYNAVMVVWNAYLFYEFLAAGWWSDLSLGCEVVNPAREGKPLRMVRVGYLYYVTKLVEMLDTLFFLLRKRFHLISFLHVFHHTALPASIWFGIKFAPGGSGSFFPMVNSFIHVIMYTYYGIAAAGPKYAKYLWWKPFMTVAQMLQFIAFILHNQQFIHRACDYPFYFCMAIYIYAWIFLILFMNYFVHEHFASSAKKSRDAASVKAGHSTANTRQSYGDYPANGLSKTHSLSHSNGTVHSNNAAQSFTNGRSSDKKLD